MSIQSKKNRLPLYLFFLCFFLTAKMFSVDPVETWRYTTQGSVRDVAYDPESKRVFCGSDDNHLYCLDLRGNVLWKYKAKGAVYGVAYDPKDKRVFCGSSDNHLYCLNFSGGLEWSYQTEDAVYGVAYDPKSKRIFCGSYDHHLYCLDLSGNPLWSYEAGSYVYGIACDPKSKRIFCGSLDNHLHCLDYNGERIWKYNAASIWCHLSLAINLEDHLIFLPSSHEIGAIDYGTPPIPPPPPPVPVPVPPEPDVDEEESIAKMEEMQVVIDYCPKLFPELVCTPIVSDRIYTVSTASTDGKHKFRGLTRKLDEIWSKKFLSVFPSFTPLVIDRWGNIYFLSKEGNICQIRDQEQYTLFDEKDYLSPTIGDNELIYFSSRGGTLYCFNLKTKGLVWEERTQSETIWPSPVIDQSGAAYFASQDTLYAISPAGERTLEKQLGVPICSPLRIDREGNLYFLSATDTLTCVDKEGVISWRYQAPGITLPAFDLNGYGYVGSLEGKIDCIEAKSGESVWQRTTKDKSSIEFAPTSNDKGEVFFLAKDGTLYRKRNKGFLEKAPFNWFY